MAYLDTYMQPLDPLWEDPDVIEVSVNANGDVWVERAGDIHMSIDADIKLIKRKRQRNPLLALDF